MKIIKKYYKEFLLRGLVAMGFGGITLSLIYLILGLCGVVEQLGVYEVVVGYLSITALAFICGSTTSIYQIEELPLSIATTIHGITLYLIYVIVYVVNNWLKDGIIPFLVFTLIFILGYALIWIIIYIITYKAAKKLNNSIKTRVE